MDAGSWDQRYAENELVWSAEPNRFLVAETESLPPGRVLDLACGEGRNALWLAERGWQATGVDFSAVAVEKARAIAAKRGIEATWIAADLLTYEPERHAFDLVLVFYLQVPAEERRAILRNAASAVAPGGTFLLVGHDSANLEHGYGGPKSPAVLYTPEDVAADLDGLTIEKAATVERTVDEHVALDVLVRATRP